MPIDFESICADNIRRRGEEFDDIGQFVAEKFYSDQTHFVYELLQNAEDALSRREREQTGSDLPRSVEFNLFPDRLEVRHFGQPFNEDDVRGVSDILKGTKQQDASQIGTFGIGFKSVYAFTATPAIHSGDAHFCIERYIRPREVNPRALRPGETLFIFLFDHSKVSARDAFERIGERLRGLGTRTLLFLRHIENIKWRINGGESGTYVRVVQDEHNVRSVSLISKTQSRSQEENWLVFQRYVDFPENSGKGLVEIAFKLQGTDSGLKRIECLDDSPLSVYFPTALDSKLGFLVQGPYETTPTRDHIKSPRDSQWNKKLIAETAELLEESLEPLRKMDLLTLDSLQALPTRTRKDHSSVYKWVPDYPEDWTFKPLYNRTKDAFLKGDLLPCASGGHVSVGRARLARPPELINLISEEQLSELLKPEDRPRWLSLGITEERHPALWNYLTHELAVKVVDPELFARKLTKDFLKIQRDEWFVKFYNFLGSRPALWREKGVMRNIPFLRLDDDSLTVPFNDDRACAYIPPIGPSSYPVVKRCIANETKDFLRDLGLKEPDIYDDAIEGILSKYTRVTPPEDLDLYLIDVQRVIALLDTGSESGGKRLLERAKNVPFVLCGIGGVLTTMRTPSWVYLPDEDLHEYFAEWMAAFIDPRIYDPNAVDIWLRLGCAQTPRMLEVKECPHQEHTLYEEEVCNCDLDGLADFLRRIAAEVDPTSAVSLSLLLFDILSSLHRRHPDCFVATYKWYHRIWRKKEFDSVIIERLRGTEWLPTKTRGLCRPQDVSDNEVIEDIANSPGLLRALGVTEPKTGLIKDVLVQRGISSDDAGEVAAMLLEDPQGAARIILEYCRSKKEKPSLPTGSSSDPVRLAAMVTTELKAANKKEYEQRERSVRKPPSDIDPKTWLRTYYTNDDRIMVCQMCEAAMPFRLADGEYYFEAVQAWDDAELELHWLHFALCPLCAAKYKHLAKNDEETMKQLKVSLSQSDGDLRIELHLNEQGQPMQDTHTLFLVEKHLLALQTIVENGC